MKTTAFFFLLCAMAMHCLAQDLKTPWEKHGTNYTATYDEALDWYTRLDTRYKEVKLLTGGLTDIGRPLQLAVLSADGDFDPASLKKKGRRICLVINAIHAGEPEGVDASMLIARDLMEKPGMKDLLKDIVVCIIPAYNIDGVMNRTCCSRANQDGPAETGFRGNAQNLDLNRDFIKCDSRNARSFTEIFRTWDPDIFLDNHVSDGADYQYTLTYLSNESMLSPELCNFVKKELVPGLNSITSKDGFELIPYVETVAEIPDSGLLGGYSPPRFSSGYSALYNTIGFTVETHMLKPFDKRLKATYSFMKATLEKLKENGLKISALRQAAKIETRNMKEYVLSQEMDTNKYDWITFKGYAAKYKPSEVSGLQRLYYDRNAPFEKKIKYFNYFNPEKKVKVPKAYILPQSNWRVVELLKLNKVEMHPLASDSLAEVEIYYIENYENSPNKRPYEDHYLHSKTKLRAEIQKIQFHKGDLFILMNQDANQYIMSALEPEAPDAFFNWNYFDAILQQKEYFSDYVFEDVAAAILKKDPALKKQLEEKRNSDPAFAKNGQAQLEFIYHHSPYYEKTHNRYPVGRIMN